MLGSRWHLQGYLGAILGYLKAIRRQDGPKTALERPCWRYVRVKMTSSEQVNMNAHQLNDERDTKHVAKAKIYKIHSKNHSFFTHRGAILGHLRALLGASWPILRPSWALISPLRALLSPPGPLMAASWGHLGVILKPSWPVLDRLGPS